MRGVVGGRVAWSPKTKILDRDWFWDAEVDKFRTSLHCSQGTRRCFRKSKAEHKQRASHSRHSLLMNGRYARNPLTTAGISSKDDWFAGSCSIKGVHFQGQPDTYWG